MITYYCLDNNIDQASKIYDMMIALKGSRVVDEEKAKALFNLVSNSGKIGDMDMALNFYSYFDFLEKIKAVDVLKFRTSYNLTYCLLAAGEYRKARSIYESSRSIDYPELKESKKQLETMMAKVPE